MHVRREIVGWVTIVLIVACAAWWLATTAGPAGGVVSEASTADPVVAATATADASPAPRLDPSPREDAAVVPARDADTIGGVVVDEDGAPIEGAEIVTSATAGVRTDAAGRFRLRRGKHDCEREAIRIVACPEGSAHANLLVDRWLPWGTHDLRFVLERRVPLRVDLVDSQGRPVSAAVRLDESSVQAWDRRDLTLKGDGEVEFPLAAPGDSTLHVVSWPDGFAHPRPARVEVRGPTRARIVFGSLAECRVCVERADGSVARKSDVRLVVSPHDVLVDRASVDDSAHVVLRGDALVAYSVQVVGDHMPVCVEGVRCGNAEPLRVRIPAGAEVRVRPSPPDVLARLWPTRSSLGLVRASDGHVRQLLAAKADGTLSASDLAPGDWSLCFVDGPVSHTFARVTLTGTELVDLEAAMPWLRLAKMRVRVLGERNTVYLQRERPGEGPPSDREWIALPLLSSEVTVPSGRYRVRRMYVPQAVSTAVLDAPPDSSVDVEVAVPLANVEITLRDRAGLPVPDARLGLVRAGVMTREDLLPDSDGNGVVQSGCGVGTFEVVLLPKLAWEATTGGRPLTPLPLVTSLEARTLLGTITVCEGQRTVAAFVLP